MLPLPPEPPCLTTMDAGSIGGKTIGTLDWCNSASRNVLIWPRGASISLLGAYFSPGCNAAGQWHFAWAWPTRTCSPESHRLVDRFRLADRPFAAYREFAIFPCLSPSVGILRS